MHEALDSTASFMKDPKDVLLIDLDNQDRWKNNDQRPNG
jgi:hypothetical protein